MKPPLSQFFKVIILVVIASFLMPASVFAEERKPHQGSKLANATSALNIEDLTGILTPENLAGTLVGVGVSFSNVSYKGADVAAGIFTGGGEIIGFDSGIILSSGSAKYVIGPNQFDNVSGVNGLEGDADLSALSGFPTFDASILEFDFVPEGDFISFQFVFASDDRTAKTTRPNWSSIYPPQKRGFLITSFALGGNLG